MKILKLSRLVLSMATLAAFGQALYAQSARPHVIVQGTVLPLSAGGAGASPNTISAPCAFFISHGGFCAAQLRQAYMTSFIANSSDGAGVNIYIVDAYDMPDILNDVNQFSNDTGLPPLDGIGGDGTFTKATPFGMPATAVNNANWDIEIALDVEWVHAMAPRANIVLVEALSSSDVDLFNAVQYAGALADVTSDSWGAGEYSGETFFDSYLLTAHGPVLFSTGDSGAPGGYPAFSPFVTAVGGTTLHVNAIGYRSSETGWGGSGGGVSQYEPTPAYQAANGVNFGARSIPDVALDADPSTGVMVLVIERGFYYLVGGTSLACPLYAGFLADVDGARHFAGKSSLGPSSSVLNPELYALYNSSLYHYSFFDVTSGNNGFAAGLGYDLVTGLGVPSEAGQAYRLVNSIP
jgi:subtilase family serine protease